MNHDPTMATNLLPALREACDGHLGPVSWFRADWQRGGASTGTAGSIVSTKFLNQGDDVRFEIDTLGEVRLKVE